MYDFPAGRTDGFIQSFIREYEAKVTDIRIYLNRWISFRRFVLEVESKGGPWHALYRRSPHCELNKK